MTRQQAIRWNQLQDRLAIPMAALDALLKCERTLHRWAEQECGDSNACGTSWCITRDETTGKPFREVSPASGKSYREPVRDMERAALRRIAALCAENGLHWHHQTDPRGCALYVSREPITDVTYTQGVAVCL